MRLSEAIEQVVLSEGLETNEGRARYVIRSFQQQRLWLSAAIISLTALSLVMFFAAGSPVLGSVALLGALAVSVVYLRARGRAAVAREWLETAEPYLREPSSPPL